MKLVAVGPIWLGSDSGGMFQAMGRQGFALNIIDEFYYISLRATDKKLKAIHKLIRPLQVREFNNAIIRSIDLFKPDILFVFKGTFVLPSTLQYAKKTCKAAMYYPDVSMTAHGRYLPSAIPLYDLIITAKSFGITDLEKDFGITNAHFLPHGFDPAVHRKVDITSEDIRLFGCDASFIGTWTPKKEKYLSVLKRENPGIDLKIWGAQWEKATTESLKGSIQGIQVLGDVYAKAVQCSKINIGLLSEQVKGSSSGDLITARTFNIPGSFGFLLHERNEESILYFEENVDAGFFDSAEELASKVTFFLKNDDLRNKIREAGYQRSLKENSFDSRAITIKGYFNELLKQN